VSIAPFGEADGKKVQEIRLRSAAGAEASIISFGASLRDFVVPLADGKKRRVVLGYETVEGYQAGKGSVGATCGRVGNRIAGGQFTLAGKNYQLNKNENGKTHLHGGNKGFAQRVWDVADHSENSVTLRLVSPEGEESYPGNLEAFCIYRLLEPATIRVEMTATSDAPTLVNMVNHSYFTLAEDAEIWDHKMQIASGFITTLDGDLIPTGEIRSVTGTPYDFRSLRPIRHGQGGKPFDYDINFVLDTLPPVGQSGDVAVKVVSPNGDLTLECATNEPGMQLYTGAVVRPWAPGVGGQKHFPHAGFCLEAQRFPDAIHNRHFAQATLLPGEVYRQVTEYRFK
jgi:aldose 1-epimerase